jgi:hypothetical protein
MTRTTYTAYACDRCGLTVTPRDGTLTPEGWQHVLVTRKPPLKPDEYHLCYRCSQDHDAFMEPNPKALPEHET